MLQPCTAKIFDIYILPKGLQSCYINNFICQTNTTNKLKI